MDKLDIKADKQTPKIFFDPDEKNFTIIGSCLPENVHAFFKPIVEWLDEYTSSLSVSDTVLTITTHLSYYNSGSLRYLSQIFGKFAEIQQKGQPTEVYWYHDKEDDLLKEAGEDMAELIGMKFNILEAS